MIQAINPNDETQKTARREQLTALFGKFPIQGIEFKKKLLEHSLGIVLFKGKEYLSGGIIFMKPLPPTRSSKNPLPGTLVIISQRRVQPHVQVISLGGDGPHIESEKKISLSTTSFQIVKCSDITAVDFTQVICDDPDCANCVQRMEKGESWPYYFRLQMQNMETSFTLDSFEECAELAQDIMAMKGRSK